MSMKTSVLSPVGQIISLAAAFLLTIGCEGEQGRQGAPGPGGQQGPQGEQGDPGLSGDATITVVRVLAMSSTAC